MPVLFFVWLCHPFNPSLDLAPLAKQNGKG